MCLKAENAKLVLYLSRIAYTPGWNIVVAVSVAEAGEGNMEISITAANGRNLPNQVLQVGGGMFEVSFSPLEPGRHRANVLFNCEHVPGMHVLCIFFGAVSPPNLATEPYKFTQHSTVYLRFKQSR